MAYKTLPSQERLCQLFVYDEVGVLRWRETRTGYASAGSIAGTIGQYGYRRALVDGSFYAVHRIVWKMHTGNDPMRQLDHINGDKDDNRIENLREATCSQNVFCASKTVISKSGVRGVYYIARLGKYKASYRKDRKSFYLGLFEKIEDARAAYESATAKAFAGFK